MVRLGEPRDTERTAWGAPKGAPVGPGKTTFFVNQLQRTIGFLSFFESDCKEPTPTIAKNQCPRGPREANPGTPRKTWWRPGKLRAAQEQPGTARRGQEVPGTDRRQKISLERPPKKRPQNKKLITRSCLPKAVAARTPRKAWKRLG